MGLFDFFKNLLGNKKPLVPPLPEQIYDYAAYPIPSTRSDGSQQRSGGPQRSEYKLDLSAAQFQPLPEDQVRKQAASTQFTGFFEFGRRSRIPSLIDPRTKLIDQAMVGMGLVTAEELVQIHEVGQEYDQLKPDIASVHVQSKQAVAADRAARQQIREQKKAAAAQRRLEHAQRVAHNKLTDIIHLGRGVSAGLADRRGNVEKLQQRGLPVLSTPAELAVAMKIEIPRLRWLAYHTQASTISHYIQFTIPKKSGGQRTLSAPHKKLSEAQQWILENILSKLPPHDAAHGFVTGRSIVTNATPHIGRAMVINCDLTDFFPTINVHRVIGMFRQIGYSPAVATILALLTTECPRRQVTFHGKLWHVATGPRGLPQGACTSPAISNLISRRMDSRLVGIAKKLNYSYTRYADDLTFSTNDAADKAAYLLARLRHITKEEGFAINEKKTRVLKPSARQTVTGIVTNVNLAVPRRQRRRLRAILHNAGKTGLSTQNLHHRKGFLAWLKGSIEFVHMVNPNHGNLLREKLSNLKP